MSDFFTADPRTIWLFVCGGLAFLAIALLVLARLRWIQSRPITTCVVLSVFAHILLVVSACMTNLFQRPPPLPGPQVIRVSIAMDPSSDAQHRTDPSEEKPWERLPSSLPALPEPEPLDSRDLAPPEPTTSPIDQPIPELMESVPTEVVPAEDPASPAAPEASEPPAPPMVASTEPMRMDVPAPVDGPGQLNEPRPQPAVFPNQPPREGLPDELTSQEVPQIAAPPNVQEEASAVSDAQDHLSGQNVADLRHATTDTSEIVGPSIDAPTDALPVKPVDPADANWGPSPGRRRRLDVDSLQVERRLVSGQPLPKAYWMRVATDRSPLAQRRGATAETEAAVLKALAWLASNQMPDGRWDASVTGAGQERRVSGQDRASAGLQADAGITGLAILAFLGAGHTHLEGQHREVVQHGLEYLLRNQRHDGNMAGPAGRYAMMYCHGIATLSICEALAMTGDPRLTPYVQRAVGYTLSAQDPITGGWRYGPHEPGDTSQFGWQVLVLVSAELAGISVPEANRGGMLRFLESVSSGRHGGLAAYRPSERGNATRSMTAEALVCRQFLGLSQDQGALNEAADFILQSSPSAGRANLYYWYYATLGLSQMDDDRWRIWNESLRPRLLTTQRTDGHAMGSWDPNTLWGGHGGRVYSTALAALCLEVYYRYIPLQAAKVARRR